MRTRQRLIVTIDGPAGAGKTTVSKLLAEKLNCRYLDTGALYRAVAWSVKNAGVALEDEEGLGRVCHSLELDIRNDRLAVNGRDITDQIRTPAITMLASAVSAQPVVRETLLSIQRKMGQAASLVAEGRDMGTVVFPEADHKFFLDASVRQRALRRLRQYGSAAEQTLEAIEADIRQRDANDTHRQLAPLKPAEDALRIDTTSMTADAVVDCMLTRIADRGSTK